MALAILDSWALPPTFKVPQIAEIEQQFNIFQSQVDIPNEEIIRDTIQLNQETTQAQIGINTIDTNTLELRQAVESSDLDPEKKAILIEKIDVVIVPLSEAKSSVDTLGDLALQQEQLAKSINQETLNMESDMKLAKEKLEELRRVINDFTIGEDRLK